MTYFSTARRAALASAAILPLRLLRLTPILFVAQWLCGCAPGDPVQATAEAPVEARAHATRFDDIARAVGLDFVHVNGATAEKRLPEIAAGGGAFVDYDNDGDLDVLLVQSGRIHPHGTALFDVPEGPLTARLYRNALIPEGVLRFEDMTDRAGVRTEGYGMGVATGDIDNDGDMDIYVTDLGGNALLLNHGDGTFHTTVVHLDDARHAWSTSASFLDYDLDGALDLYVAQYVRIDLAVPRVCSGFDGAREYCTPKVFPAEPDLLLRGDGNGALTPVDGWRARRNAPGSGLGVVSADYDGDGWPDLYVANDLRPNLLWLNQRDGTFVETATMNGSAYNADGMVEASMGVTSGDVDGDGDEDLFMTHLQGETNTLYLNDGRANFLDSTIDFQLSGASLPATGFGTRWFDFDNDTDLDLFIANGNVMAEPQQVGKDPFPYRQRDQLFENLGGRHFADVGAASGLDALPMQVGRGAAFGDVDNDGDVDILVINANGPVTLLRNGYDGPNRWLSVRLRSMSGNRDGVGARIGVERPGHATLWRRVGTDGSYLSANDIRAHFGLGEEAGPVTVIVAWPGGAKERFAGVETNRFVTLKEGAGQAP